MLFSQGPDIIHFLERNREEVEQQWSAGSGTYETSFSTRPPDYSLWDCYRTGSGQPAIACQLTKKPDRAEREWITKKEEAAKIDDMLVQLLVFLPFFPTNCFKFPSSPRNFDLALRARQFSGTTARGSRGKRLTNSPIRQAGLGQLPDVERDAQ